MDYLVALSWLVFGGDVRDLGHRDWQARDGAHRRLEAAGVLAWPAVEWGRRTANSEASHRSDILLLRMPDRIDLGLAVVCGQRDVPDCFLRTLSRQMMADGVMRERVFAAVDSRRGFPASNSMLWAETLPYYTGSREMEFLHVLVTARKSWFAVPQRMPPDQRDPTLFRRPCP